MKDFLKDLIKTQRENDKNTKAFIRRHPVGYGVYIGSCLVLSVTPMIYFKIKDKIEEKKTEKEWYETV